MSFPVTGAKSTINSNKETSATAFSVTISERAETGAQTIAGITNARNGKIIIQDSHSNVLLDMVKGL